MNYTEFWFNHNKPNELLDVQVQIFTVSGKLIKTINQQVQTNGNLVRNIVWNGLEFDNEKFSSLIEVPKTEGLKEINEVKEHFDRFGDFIPNELESQRIELEQRLNKEL